MSARLPEPITFGAAELDGDVVRHLVTLAARWTGVSVDSIHPENVRRAAAGLLTEGVPLPAIVAGAERGNHQILESLRKAVSIGETYFFRYPEQFQHVEQLLRSTPRPPGIAFRAWSAGCATGEETYSIASMLHHLWATTSPPPTVLGTDQLAAHIEVARVGLYRPWSVRLSGPIAYPLLRNLASDQVAIRDELRAMVRFDVHNLRDPVPGAGFDLIFCRNVFIYYDPPSVRGLIDKLTAALAPTGILVFGLADPVPVPFGLRPAGPPGLRIYTRAAAATVAPRSSRLIPLAGNKTAVMPTPRTATPPAALRVSSVDPVAMHVEVLGRIERDDQAGAASLLAQIRRTAPDYLAACLEQALLFVRLGQKRAAHGCLRELLDKLAGMNDELILPGPEPLAVSYYRSAAAALLGSPAFTGER